MKQAYLICLLLAGLVACSPVSTNSQTVISADGKPVVVKKQVIDANDVWDSLRSRFKLDSHPTRKEVQTYISYYMKPKNKKNLQRTLARSKPYIYYIQQELKKRDLPSEIALLPLVESAYNPFSHSHVGAAGLWQMMPGTASGYGLEQNWWYDGRQDIYQSTQAATNYLKYLDDFFDGNWLYAVAAYDSGEGTVRRAIKRVKARLPADKKQSMTYWDVQSTLPKETREYVPRLLAVAYIIKHAEHYQLDLPNVPNQPYFSRVDIGSQIDLSIAANLSGITEKELRTLNPGYRRWATNPKGSHELTIPNTSVDRLKSGLKSLPIEKRVRWQKHTVEAGETLSHIAHKYQSTVKHILDVNHLKNPIIRINQDLIIPSRDAKLNGKHPDFKAYQKAPTNINHLQKQVTHTVRPGESSGSIAKHYHLRTGEIQFWNKTKNLKKLQPGETLVLYLSPKKLRTIKQTDLMHYYVQTGDTLGQIAEKFHVTSKQIMETNNLKNAFIRVNQKLVIPGAKTQQPVTRKTNVTFKDYQHTVKSGENLTTIAKRYNMTVKQLSSINKLTNSAIRIGDKLVVAKQNMLPYQIQPGDSLHRIASRFDISVNKVKSANSFQGNEIIQPKTLIKIPLS